MTLENILTYAEIKGYESQRHLVEAGTGFSKELVGFKVTGQHVWHWFKQSTYAATETREAAVYLHFDHSYSMNTGRSKRGTMYGIRMKMKIEDALAKVAA
jgi:hypothetical protein